MKWRIEGAIRNPKMNAPVEAVRAKKYPAAGHGFCPFLWC
jgi:hypothetical protein